MHHVMWLFVTLAAANFYGWTLRKRIGFVERALMTWESAAAISFAFVGASLAVAYGGLSIQQDAGIALYAILSFLLSWLGLRYWMPGRAWDMGAAVLALGLTMWFFSDSSSLSGGLVLMVVSLGASVGGYYATKAGLKIIFFVLCAYDVYAVWFSNTMDILMRTNPDSLVSRDMFVLSLVDQLEIGTLDVVLAAVAVVGIQRHRGMLRSLVFTTGCFASVVLLGALATRFPVTFARVPYVVVLAPLVWLFLSGKRRQEKKP